MKNHINMFKKKKERKTLIDNIRIDINEKFTMLWRKKKKTKKNSEENIRRQNTTSRKVI